MILIHKLGCQYSFVTALACDHNQCRPDRKFNKQSDKVSSYCLVFVFLMFNWMMQQQNYSYEDTDNLNLCKYNALWFVRCVLTDSECKSYTYITYYNRYCLLAYYIKIHDYCNFCYSCINSLKCSVLL